MYSNINTDIYSNYCNYLYSLEKLPWKIIGTLTFRDKSKKFNTQRSNKLREEDFLRLLDNTAFKLKFDIEKVPWFLRHESSLQPEDLLPARGIAGSGLRPLSKIPHCCLP